MRDNLSAADSQLGLPLKTLAATVDAAVVGDEALLAEARHLAAHAGDSFRRSRQ